MLYYIDNINIRNSQRQRQNIHLLFIILFSFLRFVFNGIAVYCDMKLMS